MLTADIIVGFPGESKDDHAASLAFCEKMKFSKIHTFRYSRREGTAAASFPDQVPGTLAERRSRDFLALSNRCEREVAGELAGTTQSVLLEQQRNGIWSGYTPGYVQVFVDLGDVPAVEGQIVPLKIGELTQTGLMATLADQRSG